MKIACLGWGSLIWDPRSLPIRGSWYEDGPVLPIEFARESGGKRITLVIVDVAIQVRSLWALMSIRTLQEAKNELAEREGISKGNIKHSIGSWNSASENIHGKCSTEIGAWATNLHLDAVVWTNLKYGFRQARDKMPEYDEILSHIASLGHEQRQVVEEYVRRTPRQVDTEFRRNLQRDLGWDPVGS